MARHHLCGLCGYNPVQQYNLRHKERHSKNQEQIKVCFLLHILPKGFMKIRHFGFLANICKKRNLECIHDQLGVPFEDSELQKETVQEMMLKLTGEDISLCPRCGKGHLVRAPNFLSHSSLHLLPRQRFDSS